MQARRMIIVTVACVFLVLGAADRAGAAIESRDVLKTYFETGDVPTEQQFANFLDSMVHQVEDGHLIGVVPTPDGAARLGEGESVGPGLTFGAAAGLSDDWLQQSGFLGLSFNILTETHYGYLQISAADDANSPYPMQVDYFVYETTPDTSITTATVPEPATLSLLAFGGLALSRRRSPEPVEGRRR